MPASHSSVSTRFFASHWALFEADAAYDFASFVCFVDCLFKSSAINIDCDLLLVSSNNFLGFQAHFMFLLGVLYNAYNIYIALYILQLLSVLVKSK